MGDLPEWPAVASANRRRKG